MYKYVHGHLAATQSTVEREIFVSEYFVISGNDLSFEIFSFSRQLDQHALYVSLPIWSHENISL